ncbi:hypothetical protein LCGC14_1819040 [marine sediment metagenome]|uniref:HTH luxR-type domain-containing protein n=1 Tax=marine sediment metagenome TaxID=412755 RepID=A0A0F9GJJ7_9ZZZZ
MLQLPTYGTGKLYNLAKLQERHREILRLAAMGGTDKDIANRMNVTPVMVRYTRRCALGSKQLATLRNGRDGMTADITQRIQELAPDALRVIEEVVQQGTIDNIAIDRKERLAASNKILDRAGHVPPQRIIGDINHRLLTNDSIQEIKDRAKELSAINGNLISDAEVIES